MQNILFICPYFREDGGGQEGYQNVLIKGKREGVKVNKDKVLICALLWMASLMDGTIV